MRENAVLVSPVSKELDRSEARVQELRSQILARLDRVGQACAPDLSNELRLKVKATPDELIPVLVALESDGAIRKAKNSKDHRDYKEPYQTIYELVE